MADLNGVIELIVNSFRDDLFLDIQFDNHEGNYFMNISMHDTITGLEYSQKYVIANFKTGFQAPDSFIINVFKNAIEEFTNQAIEFRNAINKIRELNNQLNHYFDDMSSGVRDWEPAQTWMWFFYKNIKYGFVVAHLYKDKQYFEYNGVTMERAKDYCSMLNHLMEKYKKFCDECSNNEEDD